MKRRTLELSLLVLAAPLVVLLFAMLAINSEQELNASTLGVPLGIFGAFFVAHLAVRKFAPNADPALLPIAFALSGIGIAFVTRVAPYSAATNMAFNQVIWLFLGVACMIAVLVLFRNPDRLANYKYTFMIIGFVLLLSPLIPGLGLEINGSRIWLNIADVFTFQPGEIAKIVIVLFLAGYLAANREMLSVFTWRVGPFNLPDIRVLLPLLLMWAVALLIVVFEKDLGSALVFFFVFIVMLYVATGKKFYLVLGGVLIALGGVLAWALFSHVQVRVDTWLDPFADAQDKGFQLVQAIYSMADGGLFGTGIGRGMAGGLDGIGALPVVESDFIFAAIAEEAGLLGAAGVLLLFLCFAIRGFVTAARAKSDVSSFIAVGLTAIIALQAFIIVGGVTRLIPLTGLTLPFVSQGGSSLLAGFIIVGFLLHCGNEGTGIGAEMKAGTSAAHSNSVLGRVSLGKRLTGAMGFFSLLFALLVANLTLVMVVQADHYKNLPGNNHTMAREARAERGTISTYDGVVLARSVEGEDGSYERHYPEGDLASHVVGYYSSQYGTAGIEKAYNNTLRGQQNFATWTDVVNAASGITAPGNDVTLTLNSKIQQAAQDALGGKAGACVVIDPSTGAVLGMASAPTYAAADIEALLAQGDAAESSALLNRATQALYAPGSTFKALTLATALQDEVATEDTRFNAPGVMDIGGAEVSNFDKNNYGNITLARATELSANTVFGQLGVKIGAERLVGAAQEYGFNQSIAFDLPLVDSVMADPQEMSEWETAWAADGQPVKGGDVPQKSQPGPQASALQMALVASAFAGGGVIQTPYLVENVYNANGEKSFSATPKQLSRPLSEETAKRVTKVLEGVINNGTGTAAAIAGTQVAGKTGTAETGQDFDDSWFIGYAPAENPRAVVALVIEKGTEGEAAEKAQNVLKTALSVQGLL